MIKADILLLSNYIFTGISKEPVNGFIAIKDDKIIAIENEHPELYYDENTFILDLKNQLILPGFVDTHCFFTGYLLSISGTELKNCKTESEVIHEVTNILHTNQDCFLGKGLSPNFKGLSMTYLSEKFPDTAIILFTADGESCYMNHAAQEKFNFTPDKCYSEGYPKLLAYLLNQKENSRSEFLNYLKMLNSKGITSIKEMGFDDFSGFTDTIKDLENEQALTVRVHFMSQPVAFPMNLDYGSQMREKFQSDFVRFSGFNQMTDGSISQLEGDMKTPYLCAPTCCRKEIPWTSLEEDVLNADKLGFRFSLHAQGDAAIAKSIAIFNKCQKNQDGTLKHRHAITDLECGDVLDLPKMGELNIIGEIYPQIMSITNYQDKIAMIEEKIGMTRGKNYWNRRKMIDNGITLSCATDLPLLFDNIPESIYHSVGGFFPEGGEAFNKENTISTAELLTAWTYGGQYNLGQENLLGTLEVGKLADITVLDQNVFTLSFDDIRNVKVSMTMVNGKIVYQK